MSKPSALFFGIISVLFLANMLLMNDVLSYWPGSESWLVWRKLHDTVGFSLHEQVIAWFISDEGGQLFWMRLPGVLVLLAGLLAFSSICKSIFGKTRMQWTLLVLMGSWLIPNLAKIASGDLWAFSFQLIGLSILLRYLKQPSGKWQWLLYLAFALSIWEQPIQSTLFLLLLSIGLYYFHPQGKNLGASYFWLVLPGLFLLNWGLNGGHWSHQSFFFKFPDPRFLYYNLLAYLPFAGFLLAGIRESISLARKKEEFSRLILICIFSALVGHSLCLQIAFALLIARHLEAYFHQAYPWRNLVRGTMVILLVLTFCASALLLMLAFRQWGGLGFRAALAPVALYWISSFIAIIGLYGLQRYSVWGGVLMGAILLSISFWTNLNPFSENQKQAARDFFATKLQNAPENLPCFILQEDNRPFSPLAAYAKSRFEKTTLLDNSSQLNTAWEKSAEAIFILPVRQPIPDAPVDTLTLAQLSSGNLLWPDISYLILKKTK
ncbi:MAG TPA: hypothetical protein PKA00_20375 [Saprospiraceae bacterium]|nr:hypothetical protein [Saprospiraceae bacterium]HMQ85278.1 hypothetical protein [Saprospiraceae bacterium]